MAALRAYGRVPQALESTAGSRLQNMMLLFIPAIAGVMLHFDRIAREWLPFLVAGIVGAAITLLVTAWTLRWLLRDISSHSFVPFAYYRIVFGVIVLVTAWTGWVQWAE